MKCVDKEKIQGLKPESWFGSDCGTTEVVPF